jgi:signal transduction histidine kinase
VPALEQLFLNLLLNAAQSLDDGGRVEVTVARLRDGVSIAVRDSGRGIPPEDIERVAEPFFSTRPRGTGLGLAIAQRIAIAHSGGLEIESTPGAGTTVRLKLQSAEPA